LNLSKNKLGLEGAKHLSEAVSQMKALIRLDLAENEIGDIGICEIVKSLRDSGIIEHLDLSANKIGKSSLGNECTENIRLLLHDNRLIECFKINWNSLRGVTGEKVIEGLVHCTSLKTIELNNNLLGMGYEDSKEKDPAKRIKEPPICKLAELLSTSHTL
jgi:Ran GTPase-activating protein (RanGAP) involved in mRNA processing and transport